MGPRSRSHCVRTQCSYSGESLPGTGILSTDAAPSLTRPTDTHAASSPSPSLDSPPIFDCNLPAWSACALNEAYLAVSRVQPRMDTHLYASHDTCAVCAAGGTLVCCDFCDVAFHATCIPALRPHFPPAGLACIECFADSFPDQRAAFDRLFFNVHWLYRFLLLSITCLFNRVYLLFCLHLMGP